MKQIAILGSTGSIGQSTLSVIEKYPERYAVASLAAAFFIPDRFHSNAGQMIDGIHKAFFVLGGLTVISTVIFRELKASDGANASQHKFKMHLLRSINGKLVSRHDDLHVLAGKTSKSLETPGTASGPSG